MPYALVKVKGGYKVQNMQTGKYYSSHPMSKEQAMKQMLALHIHTGH
jgi:hypothetical protein